jgi:Protein of unknown function (DUF4230)
MASETPNQLPEQSPPAQPPEMLILPTNSPPPAQRSGCFWGIAGAAGCLLVLLLPIIVLLLVGGLTINSLVSGITGIFTARPPVASVISSQTIVTSIQPMGQLVSVSAQLAKADISIAIQQGALDACSFSANHVAQGTIEAGIDLTKLSEADVQYDQISNTYTVTLPAAQLTSCRIDFIRQYERSLTACPVDWDEARLLANYEAINEFRNDSVEGGIIDRAEREAQITLGNFIHLLTGATVNIVFKSESSAAFPTSCIPDIPEGWVLDEATYTWSKS